jgi:hypothetical protein
MLCLVEHILDSRSGVACLQRKYSSNTACCTSLRVIVPNVTTSEIGVEDVFLLSVSSIDLSCCRARKDDQCVASKT